MDARRLIFPAAVGVGALVILWSQTASASAVRSSGGFTGPVLPGGRLMSRYGRRTINGASQFHLGMDLAAPKGSPIYAPVDAVVRGAWPDGEIQGYGNMAVLEHLGTHMGTLYAHMDRLAVSTGQQVRAGDVVGYVGCTDSEGGFPCAGSHLHLELLTPAAGDDRAWTHFRGGANYYPPRIDPATWAQQVGIRLI